MIRKLDNIYGSVINVLIGNCIPSNLYENYTYNNIFYALSKIVIRNFEKLKMEELGYFQVNFSCRLFKKIEVY